jgi:hypothetical protein
MPKNIDIVGIPHAPAWSAQIVSNACFGPKLKRVAKQRACETWQNPILQDAARCAAPQDDVESQ